MSKILPPALNVSAQYSHCMQSAHSRCDEQQRDFDCDADESRLLLLSLSVLYRVPSHLQSGITSTAWKVGEIFFVVGGI